MDFEQASSKFYQQGARIDIVDNLRQFSPLDQKTNIRKSLRNEQQLNFKGRHLIGGCLDTIFCLTEPYGNMEAFKKVTKDEGHANCVLMDNVMSNQCHILDK